MRASGFVYQSNPRPSSPACGALAWQRYILYKARPSLRSGTHRHHQWEVGTATVPHHAWALYTCIGLRSGSWEGRELIVLTLLHALDLLDSCMYVPGHIIQHKWLPWIAEEHGEEQDVEMIET